MRYMLMMHAPRGTGEYQVNSWSPEDLKAHIGFMRQVVRGAARHEHVVAASTKCRGNVSAEESAAAGDRYACARHCSSF